MATMPPTGATEDKARTGRTRSCWQGGPRPPRTGWAAPAGSCASPPVKLQGREGGRGRPRAAHARGQAPPTLSVRAQRWKDIFRMSSP